MLGYILRRILSAVPVLITVAVIVFLMLRLAPGDPAAIIAGDGATTAQLERIRDVLGLNEPIYTQFVTWIGLVAQGDFGTSLISNVPVADMIVERIWPTLNLAVMTMVISIVVSVPLGVAAAWYHRTWVDSAVMAFSVLGFSVPVFVIGYLLIQLFAIELRVLPVQGYAAPSDGVYNFLRHAIMPSLTLSTIYIALIARMTRASMLNVLGEDYVRTARAKGIPETRVLFHHALRNASVPIITVVGTGLTILISGVVITESVFNIPGIGRLTVDAVLSRDYPTIQAMILFTSGIYVLINLLIDLSYTFLDPRIRY